jgi:NAD(P)-dependent dehydrogenase (short-subunit alcohol dehydrogenase family)
MFDLSGKTAVVTGAGSGIGFAIAEALGKAGAEVHVLDLTDAVAGAAVAKLQANNPGRAFASAACDVANEAAVEAAMSAICARGRRIDILVANAGISHVGNVLNTTKADMDRVYGVNVLGVFFCLKSAVKRMLADGKGGAIVNLASIASLLGLNDRFAYSMTKGAVLSMTRAVAADHVKQGIRCNCICPGRVHTPFVDGFLAKNYPGKEKEMFDKLAQWQPVGRMGRPAEIAALVLYLCSDEASFVTGAAYPIDGGRSAL